MIELPSGVWNAIYEAIRKAIPPREVTFGKVVKSDAAKQLVWLAEFGDIAIPLVYHTASFEYMDTDETGVMQLRGDKTQKNERFHTQVIVPKIGQTVCVLNPRGQGRFPMCIGVIHGHGYWQGET